MNELELIDRTLTDEIILTDLRGILAEDESPVELESRNVAIPGDARLEILAKRWHRYNYDLGLGDHSRAVVAVGGVEAVEHGVPRAGLCFATCGTRRSGN